MPRNENDRKLDAKLSKLTLKVEAAFAGQSNVEHKTAGIFWAPCAEKIVDRGEQVRPKAYRLCCDPRRSSSGG